MKRKKTWLTTDDVEDHLSSLCGLPDIGDPFKATERFIKTFAEPKYAAIQYTHLRIMRADMEDEYYA